MGWLMKRVAKIDNLHLELDSLSHTKIGTPEEPPQPLVFVLKKMLPWGLQEKMGFILMAERYKGIEPVAWAYEDETEWRDDTTYWQSNWNLASFILPTGTEWEEDEETGQDRETGYFGLKYVPEFNESERHAYKVEWIPTGYNGEGYWTEVKEAQPMTWKEYKEIIEESMHDSIERILKGHSKANIYLLPEGNVNFLSAKRVFWSEDEKGVSLTESWNSLYGADFVSSSALYRFLWDQNPAVREQTRKLFVPGEIVLLKDGLYQVGEDYSLRDLHSLNYELEQV